MRTILPLFLLVIGSQSLPTDREFEGKLPEIDAISPHKINNLSIENKQERSLFDADLIVKEVEDILKVNKNLPRLTRGEIYDLLEKLSKDGQFNDQNGNKNRGAKALMLVMPYMPSKYQNNENLEELYTKAPIIKMIGNGEESSSEESIKINNKKRKIIRRKPIITTKPVEEVLVKHNNKESTNKYHSKYEADDGFYEAKVEEVKFKPIPFGVPNLFADIISTTVKPITTTTIKVVKNTVVNKYDENSNEGINFKIAAEKFAATEKPNFRQRNENLRYKNGNNKNNVKSQYDELKKHTDNFDSIKRIDDNKSTTNITKNVNNDARKRYSVRKRVNTTKKPFVTTKPVETNFGFHVVEGPKLDTFKHQSANVHSSVNVHSNTNINPSATINQNSQNVHRSAILQTNSNGNLNANSNFDNQKLLSNYEMLVKNKDITPQFQPQSPTSFKEPFTSVDINDFIYNSQKQDELKKAVENIDVLLQNPAFYTALKEEQQKTSGSNTKKYSSQYDAGSTTFVRPNINSFLAFQGVPFQVPMQVLSTTTTTTTPKPKPLLNENVDEIADTLSPDMKELLQKFGLLKLKNNNKEVKVENPALNFENQKNSAFSLEVQQINPSSYTQFKPLPNTEEAKDDMLDFLRQFGLTGSRTGKKINNENNKNALSSEKSKKVAIESRIDNEKINTNKENNEKDEEEFSNENEDFSDDGGNSFEDQEMEASEKVENFVFKPENGVETSQDELEKLNKLMVAIKELEKLNKTSDVTDEDLKHIDFEGLKELVMSLNQNPQLQPQPNDSLDNVDLSEDYEEQEVTTENVKSSTLNISEVNNDSDASNTNINVNVEETKVTAGGTLENFNGPDPVKYDDFGLSKNEVKRQSSTTSAPPKKEDESKNTNIEALIESFGGNTEKPSTTTEEATTTRRTGFYYLLDWNSFFDIDNQKGKRVNLRFQPKVGDPKRFYSVSVP